MKFGKVESIEGIDFSLPPEPEKNKEVLERLPQSEAKMYFGCTSWGMKEWKGRYYPEKTPVKNFLLEYGKQFNSIELNTTHYGTPKEETLAKWYDETPDDFLFCPKIHKAISHRKLLGTDSDIIENTIATLSLLKEKLGPCFMQLPPYFDYDRKDILETFLQAFPDYCDLGIELRHESWFDDSDKTEELQELCIKYGKTLLITDVSGRRDVLHMRLCGDYLMIRFVGNGLHPTDYTRVDEWIDRIHYYTQNGVKNIFFFPHEPDNLLAPDLANYICKKIKEKTAIMTRGPKKIDSGQQLNLF